LFIFGRLGRPRTTRNTYDLTIFGFFNRDESIFFSDFIVKPDQSLTIGETRRVRVDILKTRRTTSNTSSMVERPASVFDSNRVRDLSRTDTTTTTCYKQYVAAGRTSLYGGRRVNVRFFFFFYRKKCENVRIF